MTKVALNKCYGGFGLSALAMKRIAELNNESCYAFKLDYDTLNYIPIPIEKASSYDYFFKVPEVILPWRNISWGDLTEEQREERNRYWDSVAIDRYTRNGMRTDPFMIQAIEELGEKANGDLAKIEIVDVPDGIDWYIADYDGIETVHENHRSWG